MPAKSAVVQVPRVIRLVRMVRRIAMPNRHGACGNCRTAAFDFLSMFSANQWRYERELLGIIRWIRAWYSIRTPKGEELRIDVDSHSRKDTAEAGRRGPCLYYTTKEGHAEFVQLTNKDGLNLTTYPTKSGLRRVRGFTERALISL